MILAAMLAGQLVLAVAGVRPAEASPPTEAAVSLRGRVLRGGDRTPAPQVHVIALEEHSDLRTGRLKRSEYLRPESAPTGWRAEVETASDGSFVLPDVPVPRIRVVVIGEGIERYEEIVELDSRRVRGGLKVFVTPDDSAYRTVVRQRKLAPPHRVASRELSREEVRTLPGTQGDPLRALQNFPGVARTPGGLGLLVLRGASPAQSRVFYGEHPVPRAFHALAISSIVPEGAIESIEFVPSNAPARYGETTGGVVAMKPRRPRRDGVHGYGKLDLTAVGALTEGKAGKGAFLVAAQRGHVDLLLDAVGRIPPRQIYTLPRYWDYQGLFDVPLGPRTELHARVLGAGDRILARQQELADPESGDFRQVPRVQYELFSQFHRADLAVTHRHGPWTLRASPSFRFENNVADTRRGSLLERWDYYVNWRVEAERALSRRASLLVGTDGEIDPYRVDTTLGTPSDSGDDLVRGPTETTRGLVATVGTYMMASVRFGPVSLWPGVRFAGHVVGDQREFSVDPNVSAAWEINERWSWRLGVGQYSQARIPQETETGGLLDSELDKVAANVVLPAAARALEPRAGFLPVPGQLGVARAVQASTTVSYMPAVVWIVELGAFVRRRDNADGTGVVGEGDERVEVLTPTTVQLDYGLEVLLRRRLSRRLYGWIAYTLSRSELQRTHLAPSQRVVPGPFDQRHILAILASYALPHDWRVGGRFRIVSGSPYTPLVGVIFDGDGLNEGEILTTPVFGGTNAARFPIFHQLDLRVDRTWFLRRTRVTAYLDVQNVYNRQNVEAYLYDALYLNRTSSLGLPILPSIGVRVDY